MCMGCTYYGTKEDGEQGCIAKTDGEKEQGCQSFHEANKPVGCGKHHHCCGTTPDDVEDK